MVIETAKNSIETFDGILKLQKDVEAKIQELGSRSSNAELIINHLFQRPIIDAQMAYEITKLSLPSVYRLIKDLKILDEITGGKRGKLFVFNDYLKLFK